MREVHINLYIRSHLAEMMAVLNLLDRLAQRESTLELHRFFTRLQVELGEDPRAIIQLLFGLGEEEKSFRFSSQSLEALGKSKLEHSGLDLENPELFESLEWLALEIQKKALMWKTLAAISSRVPAWRGIDFKSREQTARSQRDRIETVRIEVAAEVLRED